MIVYNKGGTADFRPLHEARGFFILQFSHKLEFASLILAVAERHIPTLKLSYASKLAMPVLLRCMAKL